MAWVKYPTDVYMGKLEGSLAISVQLVQALTNKSLPSSMDGHHSKHPLVIESCIHLVKNG